MYLRPAAPGDEDPVAQVHVRSWQTGYRGLLPDEFLDRLDPAERAARYTFGQVDRGLPSTTIAVDGDQICGFATTGPCRDEDRAGAGELYAIYVDPDWWGRGVGRELIVATRQRLSDQHFSSAILWMLAGNARAERFYRLDGWSPDGTCARREIAGIEADEVRLARLGLT